jgi:hypothetical protein
VISRSPSLEEGFTSPVLIICPKTGQLVPTGIFAETLDDLASRNQMYACPACGADHEWSADEATVANQTP